MRTPPRAKSFAFAVVLLSGAGVLAGCLQNDPLVAAVSAPKADSGMTLFLVTQAGMLSRFSDPTHRAEYQIYYGDQLVYPPGGKGAGFPVDGRSGSTFIPYNLFVVGNGEYDVVVQFEGSQTRTRANVEKWVNYVFLHPSDHDESILVDLALTSVSGGTPEDRILADGELTLAVHYRGVNGQEDRTIGSVIARTTHEKAASSIEVPRSRFDQGAGYYSLEPRYANLEARNNVQVAGDPTMANRDPPWNWIFIAK